MTTSEQPDFWSPEFNITTRPDGTILMEANRAVPDHLPTLADYLDHWADTTPDHPWMARRVGDSWRKITFGEARDMARRIGAALIEMGLGADRPLLILSGNSLEHAVLGAACFYVGVPYAPISPAYSLVSQDHGKLRDIAALLKPGALFAEDLDTFDPAIKAIATSETAILSGADIFGRLQDTDPAGATSARAKVGPETVVKYLFTSGSTGAPKAVVNTNRMICYNQAMVRDTFQFLIKRPPVVLDWAPWNHTAAGNKVSYLTLTNGGTYYIDDGKPAPGKIEETLRNLRDIPCTWYFNVPVGWDLIIDALETDAELAKTFFSQLSMMFYAGAGLSQHTWDRIRAVAQKTTGQDVLMGTSLGATETAPFAVVCTTIEESAGNIGVPAAGLSMKLVPNGGKLELRLKGPSIFREYYGDPKKTAESFDEEGYYCMGDALRPVDENDLSKGFLYDGRVAENFKLNTGTWVSVGSVRSALVNAMDGLIADAVIVGEGQAELGALMILSQSAKTMNPSDLNAALQNKLTAAAKAATGSASRIKRAIILEEAPSFDKGEVTEKGSLNQRALRANNVAVIESLYDSSGAAIVA